jgi:hypothetical protein
VTDIDVQQTGVIKCIRTELAVCILRVLERKRERIFLDLTASALHCECESGCLIITINLVASRLTFTAKRANSIDQNNT